VPYGVQPIGGVRSDVDPPGGRVGRGFAAAAVRAGRHQEVIADVELGVHGRSGYRQRPGRRQCQVALPAGASR